MRGMSEWDVKGKDEGGVGGKERNEVGKHVADVFNTTMASRDELL
jgi:hypothetical protein